MNTFQTLMNMINPETRPFIHVYPTCNWCSTEQLIESWSRMSEDGSGKWKNLQITSDRSLAQFYIIINAPRPHEPPFPPEQTILFRMEPHMELRKDLWGNWSNPKRHFLFNGFHDLHHNNCEWWIKYNYKELLTRKIVKSKEDCISTVLSSRYVDIGHRQRINFAKRLESDINLDVYGSNNFSWINYRGRVEDKGDALLPYKYTFNAENHYIKGYFTEKLIDAILSESLIFYKGAPDIGEYIEPEAYVLLSLHDCDYEKDVKLIQTAIREDWYSQRLPAIRRAKHKLLTEQQFFPRVYNILQSLQTKESTHL